MYEDIKNSNLSELSSNCPIREAMLAKSYTMSGSL